MSEKAPSQGANRTSNGEYKELSCLDCGKVYESQAGLNYHYKNTNCDGLGCPYCDKSIFISKMGVAQHVNKAHEQHYSVFEELTDREWYYSKYVLEGYSTADIADLVGCSNAVSKTWKRRHDIPTVSSHKSRGTGEDSHSYNPDVHFDVICENCDKEITIRRQRYERGDNYFCTPECHHNWRSENWVGENNPLYKGGPINYGKGWNRQKEKRLETDNHECQCCGQTEDLEVHHIRPVRSFDNPEDAHYQENLITLCLDCHTKWEGIPLRPQHDS